MVFTMRGGNGRLPCRGQAFTCRLLPKTITTEAHCQDLKMGPPLKVRFKYLF